MLARLAFILILVLLPSAWLTSNGAAERCLFAAGFLLSADSELAGDSLISHAFVQTDAELHYFRDVSSHELAFVNKR